MLEFVKWVLEIAKRIEPGDFAKFCAYLVAPGLVFVAVVSGVFGGPLSFDMERPIAISELRTQMTVAGQPSSSPGVALIVEPIASESRIRVESDQPSFWTSLSPESTIANKDRLVIDRSGITAKPPFLGVPDPVTIVIPGQLGKEIEVPGGTMPVENWQLTARRSASILSGTLLACVFAFGIALTTVIPVGQGNDQAAS
ncbi:MAG TPA: hypothetical protein VE377_06745 [Candidatus Dormibacteraeota bacterium]|nr:hypothetical protein [Candidatus Dormibacteraeota bacterium]